MNTGLRAAVIVAGVASAAAPIAAFFSNVEWNDTSVAVIALAGFVFLLAPHAPLLLTARYEPVGRGRLFGLLACEVVFGLVPAAALGLFALNPAGGMAFAVLLLSGGIFVWLIQLFVFAVAARAARGGGPRHTPAYLRWV